MAIEERAAAWINRTARKARNKASSTPYGSA
jgi:hypothetical protein